MSKIGFLTVAAALVAAPATAETVQVDPGRVSGLTKIASDDIIAKYYCKIYIDENVIDEDVAKMADAAKTDNGRARLFAGVTAKIVFDMVHTAGSDWKFCDLLHQSFPNN